MAGEPETAGILYIRGLPKDLKAHFKAFCAKRGISMTEKIAEMMRDAVKTADAKAKA